MKLAIVCTLVAITLVSKSIGGSSTKPKPDINNNAVNCTGIDGYICSDDPAHCNNRFYCETGRPGVAEVPCPYNTNCNAGSCTTTLSPTCQYKNQTFQCTSEGLYPEPSSCRRYNFCLPNKTNPIQARCEHGWAYNPVTNFCDKQLQNYACADYDKPIPQCLTLGQNEALKTNPVLYYVCLPYDNKQPTVLYPFLYKCPRNTKYTGNYVCK